MRNRILRTFAVLAAAAAWAAISCEGPVEPPEGPIPWDYYPIKDLNERASVADVYMLSASEGWAVANDRQGGPYFLHYDGSAWAVEEDLSAEYPDVTVMRLSFSAADDGWAVGHAYLPSGRYGGHVFHYDGQSWAAVTDIPVDLRYYYRFHYDVEAVAPDDVWLTGGRGVLHYNGGMWEEYDVTSGLTAFSFSKPDEGWGVGEGRYYRWNGSTWELASGIYQSSLDIASPSETAAWTVGCLPGGCEMPSQYEISLWDETKQEWVRYYGGLFKDPYFTLERVHFASPTDGWAVGSNIIIRYDGAKWREFAVPPSGANCVFTLGGDDVWVGGWGCLFKYAPFEKG